MMMRPGENTHVYRIMTLTRLALFFPTLYGHEKTVVAPLRCCPRDRMTTFV